MTSGNDVRRRVFFVYERYRIPCLDTSAASIEEMASRVLLRTGLRRNAY